MHGSACTRNINHGTMLTTALSWGADTYTYRLTLAIPILITINQVTDMIIACEMMTNGRPRNSQT
jgi:hypothetical protein